MSGSIEEVAKSWLADPAWQKVFKHTFDVLEDYVAYSLITVGAIALSVRLLTTLSSGDLACIIVGVEANGSEVGSLRPYVEAGSMGFMNYAQTEESCIKAVYSVFMEYLPYIMLIQTLLLVVVEKFTFRIPRIAQKVERFYKNIVEESLFGKDPDVAEDMTDPKTSTEAISRRRQRNEICVSLKRSSIIHHVYIAKNFIKVLLIIIFLPENVGYALTADEEGSACSIPIMAFPGVVPGPGEVHFQCRGKKLSFFMMSLWIQTALLAAYGLLSLAAIVWCWQFRAVTNLLHTVEQMRSEWDPRLAPNEEGQDFLFLFDLLAHTCGIESTLRVLTHSDDNFYDLCKPNLNTSDHLVLEEDKLKVSWKPADIERWMHDGKRYRSQRAIDIDSYEVTIFPAESVINSYNIRACRNSDNYEKNYSHWFYDLNGGRTEYVVTIACMIGKSRMKGEKIVTNLVPYGPEKPRTGMTKPTGVGTNQVEIFWDPPKGEFTKYTLEIDKTVDTATSMPSNILRVASNSENSNSRLPVPGSTGGDDDDEETAAATQAEVNFDRSNLRQMENLSFKLTSYTILGLEPGEKYRVTLGTKTGKVFTRQPVTDIIMTKPMKLSDLVVDELTSTECVVRWLPPDGHPCLKAYSFRCVTAPDGREIKSLFVRKELTSFAVKGLSPASDYDLLVSCFCVFGDTLRTEGEPQKTTITTLPEPVKNFRVDAVTANSITVRWDQIPGALSNPAAYSYRLSIEAVNLDYKNSQDHLTGDKTTYMFSKLPEVDGSGRMYVVKIWAVVVAQREKEAVSKPVEIRHPTIPKAPVGPIRIGSSPMEITWTRSPTPTVTSYRVKCKSSADDAPKAEEAVVDARPGSEEQSFKFANEMEPGVVYKVNVFAMVTFGEPGAADYVVVESKELHEKLVVGDGRELRIFQEGEA